jgi:A/G-specific adenine glycosylase
MEYFLQNIYKWYNINKRDLPWRNTSDPYKIWLSEIILQQTRVEQGKKYYLNFVEKYPDVHKLAQANEDEVLKLWQGLGYYSRARNLHVTAKYVSRKLNGKFPNDFAELQQLKGIGNYTAAAIASIAFNLPHAALDGNIYRVLSRYFGIATPINSVAGKQDFTQLANEILNKTNPGMHNQALMEFGALQCTPKSPNCFACPINETCYALIKKHVEKLPVKNKNVKQTTRFFYYYYIDDGKYTFLEKRTKADI